MYSFHPFGGLTSHPYGGSISGSGLNLTVNPGDLVAKDFNAAKNQLNARKKSQTKKRVPPARNAANKATSALRSGMSMLDTMKASMGASQRAAETMAIDTAAVAALKKNLSKIVTSSRISPDMLEQPFMAVGGEEEGFFSKYKNFIIIGSAVVVVGVAAFVMRRNR
jgi:hypothetical protein